jgi:8-oxo-dGTP pyrophosphatase MutT (NUDIX family)
MIDITDRACEYIHNLMPDRTRLRTTWDGLFISEEPPHGATIVVFRRGPASSTEFLVLHRSRVKGDGDWSWGPPAGARLPGEAVDACAGRELEEETGLRLALHIVSHDPAWASFWAEAPIDAEVVLSSEHDRYEWVSLEEAVRRCQPMIVSEQFEILAGAASTAA